MKHDRQIIWLALAVVAILGMATWSPAAYIKCEILDGSDFEEGTLIIQCDGEDTKKFKVGDKFKGKKVVKKAYEGC